MDLVLKRVTRLTAQELEQLLGPIDRALVALRQGVSIELQWQVLASGIEVALSIEGLPPELYYQELDDVSEAMRLHRFQLEQLSAAEVLAAVEAARTRVHQAGGQVVNARSLEGVI